MSTGLEQVRKIRDRYEKEQADKEGLPCGCSAEQVCSVCYYDKLGELVEKHPIVSPKRGR